MTLFTTDVSGSMVTMPPLISRGDSGEVVAIVYSPPTVEPKKPALRDCAGFCRTSACFMASLLLQSRGPVPHQTSGRPSDPAQLQHWRPPRLHPLWTRLRLGKHARQLRLQSLYQGLAIRWIDPTQHEPIDVDLDSPPHTHPR